MSAIDQRMFYLMLSPVEGQSFAHSMGFPPPSEDVQEIEIMDVFSRWLLAQRAGTLEDIRESASWFVSFLAKNDKLVSPAEDFESALTVFAVSMVNKLLDKGFIGIIMDEETTEEDYYE
jgi:hypothetical protein